MKITDILKPKHIVPELKSKTKEDSIRELIDLLAGDERITNTDEIISAVLEREKIMSTGVGKGFAIPHAKTNAVKDIVAGFGKSEQSIDFDALDGQPVNLIFLLVGRDNLVGEHIKLLSRISRMMNNEEFRSKLKAAESSEKIFKIFEEEENKLHK
jgi:fructose-specific phosphotransferase system IIA component